MLLLDCLHRIKIRRFDAPVAELADALDLGSSVPDVKVQVLSGAPYRVFLQNFKSFVCHSVFYSL